MSPRLAKPLYRLGIVRADPKSELIPIGASHSVLCVGVPLFGRLAKPFHRVYFASVATDILDYELAAIAKALKVPVQALFE